MNPLLVTDTCTYEYPAEHHLRSKRTHCGIGASRRNADGEPRCGHHCRPDDGLQRLHPFEDGPGGDPRSGDECETVVAWLRFMGEEALASAVESNEHMIWKRTTSASRQSEE